jgi:hypothetical protein
MEGESAHEQNDDGLGQQHMHVAEEGGVETEQHGDAERPPPPGIESDRVIGVEQGSEQKQRVQQPRHDRVRIGENEGNQDQRVARTVGEVDLARRRVEALGEVGREHDVARLVALEPWAGRDQDERQIQQQ